MGERSNIAIDNFGIGNRVYLYGHWMGDRSLAHAAHGLRSGRATDPSYLARVIFSSMVKSDIDGETGYGISSIVEDNNYPILVIDVEDGKVRLEDCDATESFTFGEFLSWLDLEGDAASLDRLCVRLGGEADED